MLIVKKILTVIDFISRLAASGARWFAWLLILVGAYDTIARHFFNAPTIWAYDTLCIAGGTLYVLGWAYDYLCDCHTRVDLIYRKLSPKKQAFMDVISSLFLFFPLVIALLKVSTDWTIKAWRIKERMISTFWYPPAAPYRTIFTIGLFLLLLQGTASFIRNLYFIIRGEPLDST